MMQTICLYCGDRLLGFDIAHVCSRGPHAVKLKPKMNTQISELEAQCWESRQYGPDWFNSRKFAELIVRQCINIACNYDKPKLSGPGHAIASYMESHFDIYIGEDGRLVK